MPTQSSATQNASKSMLSKDNATKSATPKKTFKNPTTKKTSIKTSLSIILNPNQIALINTAVPRFLSRPQTTHETSIYSWDNCHKYLYGLYQKSKGKGFSSLNSGDQEMAKLQLGFYLASWGMFRGGAFIRRFDHNIYGEILDAAFDKKYDLLWDVKITPANKSQIVGLLNKAFQDIKGILGRIRSRIIPPQNLTVTETLITKILLGIFACLPAYDTYFKNVLAKLPLTQTCENQISKLVDFVLANPVFDALAKQYGYPVMKILDMAFFEIGFDPKLLNQF